MKALTLALSLLVAGSFAMADDAKTTTPATTPAVSATATTPAAVPGKKVAKMKKHNKASKAPVAPKAE